jgi:ligand-binding sensor domain-containing protein
MVLIVVIVGRVASWWTEARRPPLKVLPGIVRWGPFADVNTLALVGRSVWAGGKDGIFVVDRDSGQVSWPFGSNGQVTFVEAIVSDKSGCLWIGHSRGLSRYDGTNLTTWDSRDGLPDNRVFAVMFDSSGRLWVGTQKGAAVREGASWRVVDHRDGLSVDMVRTMLQDSAGGYWFGSSAAPKGGLTLLEQETPIVFNVANGLPHNSVVALSEDREGGIWVGTGFVDRGGAAHLARSSGAWRIDRRVSKADGLAGEKVRSVFEDREGILWFGSESDGLACYDKGRWRIVTTSEGLPHNEIKCIGEDEQGNIWIGTCGGVVCLDDRLRTALSLSPHRARLAGGP